MKKFFRHIATVIFPLVGLSALLGSCASTTCNNDACYDRNVSSVDPYRKGDVAAWGSEKEIKEKEEEEEVRMRETPAMRRSR